MCGIVGYIGPEDAVPLLMNGLKRLEYRGYDSAGIAVIHGGDVLVRKSVGRLDALEELLDQDPIQGRPGIGHTRWATHGEPSVRNGHPHVNEEGTLAVVHNGIIENYQVLREQLEARGIAFKSDTDTEVIAHLLDQELRGEDVDFMDAFCRTLRQLRGAYALGIVSSLEPEKLYAARYGSPLIIGIGDDANFIASDVPAIIHQVSDVIYLNDGEAACLTAEEVTVFDIEGNPVEAEIKQITFEAESVDRAGFETYMLKEIHEQPRVLRNLLDHHVQDNARIYMDTGALDEEYFRTLNRIVIVSCGTAYYAGMYGKLVLDHFTDLLTETDLGSEFRYRSPRLDENTLVISVSQSGETADTLASIRLAKSNGCRVFSICNVEGSSLVRESDAVLYTRAGPEIGVASTKAYTSQLLAFAFLALYIGRLRGTVTEGVIREVIGDLARIPDDIHYVLHRCEEIREIAEKHHEGPSALYLGRRFNYPTALEGALKNKEISYQHAEGYAAGEMKHGPIALINEYLPVVCICTKTDDELYEKTISNMKEVESRHGRIIALATDGDTFVSDLAEDIMYVPSMREEFSPMINVVALQLLAYYTARARGTDIDKPRNLAKSVTVE